MLNDGELVTRAQNGDLDAFGQLIARHQGAIRALCTRLAVRPDMADDLAQEVFIAAHKQITSFGGEAAFGAWLRGIARNLGKMQWRTHMRRTRREADALGEFIEEMAGAAIPEDRMEVAEQVDALGRCLEGLSEKMRQLVDWRYKQGLSSIEIAELIDGKPSSVRVSLVRLHDKLRTCLRGALGPEGCP